MAYIYALCEPDTGEIRYIGKAVDVERRLRGHLSDSELARVAKTRKAKWLRSVLARGLEPVVQILEEAPAELIDEAERHWIARYAGSGRLTNGTPGGTGGDTFTRNSPEARERWLDFMRGRVHSEEEKAKRSASQRARTADPVVRAQMRETAIRIGSTPPVRSGEANGFSRFTDVEVRSIRERHAAGETGVQLAGAYETSPSYISDVLSGKTRPDAGGPIRPATRKQRLSVADVAEVRRRVAGGETGKSVALAFGVDPSHVSKIVTGSARRAD